MSNQDEENVMDQVTLTLDDGTELLCDIISVFPVNINNEEQMYIALLPNEEKPDSEIFLYRFIQNSEEDIELKNIESDDEFEAVSDAFDELLDSEEFDEMFDEEDSEDE